MSEKLRFPSIKDLQGYTAAYIPSKKLTVEQLQDALFENYYGHLKDDIGEGITTAPVLWWQFLCDTVADAIVKTGKHYLHRQDSIIEDGELIKNIAKIILDDSQPAGRSKNRQRFSGDLPIWRRFNIKKRL